MNIRGGGGFSADLRQEFSLPVTFTVFKKENKMAKLGSTRFGGMDTPICITHVLYPIFQDNGLILVPLSHAHRRR